MSRIDWDAHRRDATFEDLDWIGRTGGGVEDALRRLPGRWSEGDNLYRHLDRHNRLDLWDQLRANDPPLPNDAHEKDPQDARRCA